MIEARRRDGVDLDAEREVDLRSVWSRITEHWWVPLGGLVLGAILGVLVSIGSGDVYRAEALIYLGQPFTPGGGGQLQSLQTNPKTVSELLQSEAVITRAANAAELQPGQLRDNVTSTPVVQAGQVSRNFTPLVEIEVRGPSKLKAERAANSFANSVIRTVVPYVANKMRLLKRQISDDAEQLADVDARIAGANEQRLVALADDTLSVGEKLIIQANSNTTLNSAESRRASVLGSRQSAEQLLSLARNVELSRVIAQAVAVRQSATSRRNAAVIGALVGLLLGALGAIVADPWLRRRSTAAV